MPRPTEQETKSNGAWWTNTRLERALIGVTILGIIIIIVLLFLVAKKQADFTAKYCDTPICLTEASKINDYIDPNINPCDDFYQFACGNFLKNAHGDENLALVPQLQAKAEREIFEVYIEPIHEDDHKMVKTVKKLFRACMNTTEVDLDGLKTIKEAIKRLGGWPVVEGDTWDERKFDWVTASYKLRELGYPYNVFLELKVQSDPDDKTSYIFEVATPYMWDYSSRNFDKIAFMTEVALMFGAKDKATAKNEITKAHELLTQLQMEIHNRYGLGAPSKFSVKDYQEKSRSINWLHFINTISGPAAQINDHDFVIFPPPETLTSWTNLISRIPRRIQANYMMWKVIEAALPYLTNEMRKLDDRYKKIDDRKVFCMKEIQKRFIPSPLDVVCDRKYMPKEKKQLVEDLVTKMQTELIEEVKKLSWMDETDRQKTLDEAKTVKIVIAQPDDYFDDKLLNDMDVDMVETKNHTFLSLLAQANRNHQSALYSQVKKSTSENLYERWYMRNAAVPSYYDEDDNLMYIPAISAGDTLYDEKRPNYLNYGGLGAQMATQYSAVFAKHLKGHGTYVRQADGWSNRTKHEGEKKFQCVEEEMQDYKLQPKLANTDFVVLLRIGSQISRAAYEKLVKNKGEEQHLIGLDYTPRQLFWISTISSYCQPINPYGSLSKVITDERIYADTFAGAMRNNPDFANDFSCPAGSKMNPFKRCRIL